MKQKMFSTNCCDGIYNSFDVHFTSTCDNKCAHCIDDKYNGLNIAVPDIVAISNAIIENKEGYDDVLFLGGEPCLYLQELVDCARIIKSKTDLKIFVTTAVPKICYDERELFVELLELCDGVNLSVQHHNETIADMIRATVSQYDRQAFYNSLPHKEKIRINLNIVKPLLYTRKHITDCIVHYDSMGFNSIKLSEIQHGKEYFTSFENVFNIKMKSPFYSGCQTYINTNCIHPNIKTPVLLKRSCFMCEETLSASFMDGVKATLKMFNVKPNNKYAVIYEDGSMERGWK